MMYVSSLCKACLRICERSHSKICLSTARNFVNRASITNPRLVNGRLNVCAVPSICDINPRLTCQKTRYSTDDKQDVKSNKVESLEVEDSQDFQKSQDSLELQDTQKSRDFQDSKKSQDLQESQDSLELRESVESQDYKTEEEESQMEGPPEELMNSLGDEDLRRLKVLWTELEVFRQSGSMVPKKMTLKEWQEVMEKTSYYQRLKYYKHLCIKESVKAKEKRKKIERSQKLEEFRATRDAEATDHLTYALNRNCIFMRFYSSEMNVVYNSWQCEAIRFGQSIVLDLGYDEHMVQRELVNCAEQIRDLYGFNKMNRHPYHLHFCNATPDNKLFHCVKDLIPNLQTASCLVTVTDKSYLDMFPKAKLVYLTPHCKNELVEYDHDAVYIIGGFVDKTDPRPISLAKAKKEQITMAQLPIDRYLDWGLGNKCLTLDQVMKVMLDIKNTGSWDKALKHVPKRKLKTLENRFFSSAKPRSDFEHRRPKEDQGQSNRQRFVSSLFEDR